MGPGDVAEAAPGARWLVPSCAALCCMGGCARRAHAPLVANAAPVSCGPCSGAGLLWQGAHFSPLWRGRLWSWGDSPCGVRGAVRCRAAEDPPLLSSLPHIVSPHPESSHNPNTPTRNPHSTTSLDTLSHPTPGNWCWPRALAPLGCRSGMSWV